MPLRRHRSTLARLASCLLLLGACAGDDPAALDGGDGVPRVDAGQEREFDARPPDDQSDGALPPTPDPTEACAGSTALRIVPVATADELTAALAGALPGDRIELADGTYPGNFVATAPGTGEAPIALCGSRAAVLQGESVRSGYGFHLQADHWVLSGFTVTLHQKGVMLDRANHNLLAGLEVFEVGDEGIHLRAFSSDNTVQGCFVHDTGNRREDFGEGIYLGSAVSNWGSISGGEPDESDRNQVLDNQLGPNVTTEAIDIKEGTTGGLVRGNTFDGDGMTGANFGDSWIDVKGNDYTIEDNQGTTALADGFQTHVATDGWGHGTVFRRNTARDVPGYGINVATASTDTVVACDNTAENAALGLSNVACQ